MSVAEIKEELPNLTVEERLEVASYIRFLNHRDDPVFQAELDQRMARMDRGEKVTSAQLFARFPELKAAQ